MSRKEYKDVHVNTFALDGKSTVVLSWYMSNVSVHWYSFTSIRLYDAGPVGLIPNPRLCLSVQDGVPCYSFQVFFKVVNAGVCAEDLSNIDCLMEQLSTTSGFVVCPGIREYPASIRFTTKNLVEYGMNPSINVSLPSVANGTYPTMLSRLLTAWLI